MGRDFGKYLRINILIKNKTFGWDGVEIPIVTREYWTGDKIDRFHEECKSNRREEAHRVEILDAKYDKINVDEIISYQVHLNLDQEQTQNSKQLSKDKMDAFKGTKGCWKEKSVLLELAEGVNHFTPNLVRFSRHMKRLLVRRSIT